VIHRRVHSVHPGVGGAHPTHPTRCGRRIGALPSLARPVRPGTREVITLNSMPEYRRARVPGGTYFFTVVTYDRRPLLCRDEVRTALRDSLRSTQLSHPFSIDAWVLLPDHLHCIWSLPPGDSDFPLRWAMVKRGVTRRCPRFSSRGSRELRSPSRQRRHESTLWQRRYWEHLIRNADDFERHLDYVHWNPVKHGYVSRVVEWEFSTFHRYVKAGVYPADWGGLQEPTDGSVFGE